jgi:hypothetical protein
MRYFLIVYDAVAERLVTLEEFESADDAEAALTTAEDEHAAGGCQVLLFGARSLETVKVTHPHYFRENGGGDTVELLAPSPAAR